MAPVLFMVMAVCPHDSDDLLVQGFHLTAGLGMVTGVETHVDPQALTHSMPHLGGEMGNPV